MVFKSNSVTEWVEYIQTLHVREIELTLERVRQVSLILIKELSPDGIPFKVISVAGTNGKGSTCEIISSIYSAAGFKAGKFSSPHLVHFNERFCIDSVDVSDQQLLSAFDAVEAARREIPITYFEYGFLVALAVFLIEKVDVAIMEVGLGGRLDAVNVLDADVAVITSIALDHTAWLGDTLEEIAYEKSGIARAGRPCIIGVRKPQTSMLEHLNQIKAQPIFIGEDFDYIEPGNSSPELENPSLEWSFTSKSLKLEKLSLPFSQAGVQLSNASLAISAVSHHSRELTVEKDHYSLGLQRARLSGRCQLISTTPHIVLDVSHNEASLIRLKEFIKSLNVKGRVIAVCGMLRDKEIVASLSQINTLVSQWHLSSIAGDRGSTASQIEACLIESCVSVSLGGVFLYDDAQTAYRHASKELTADDCLVVFGSFYLVGDIIALLELNN